MLQVMLVFQGSVQCLHARREMLARIVVKVAESYLVFASGCLRFKQIEVDGVVIRQSHEHAVDALVFHDDRQEFAGFEKLRSQSCSEVRLGNSGQVLQRYICDTFPNEDLPGAHKIESFFEWHLDVVLRSWLISRVLFIAPATIESDIDSVRAPLRITLFDRFVVETKVVDYDLLDALRVCSLQSEVKETALLR